MNQRIVKAVAILLTLLMVYTPAYGVQAQEADTQFDTTIVLFVYNDFLRDPVEHCEINSIAATELSVYAGFSGAQHFMIADLSSTHLSANESPVLGQSGCVFWGHASLEIEDHYFGSIGGDTMEGGTLRDIERNGFLLLAINSEGGIYGAEIVDGWSPPTDEGDDSANSSTSPVTTTEPSQDTTEIESTVEALEQEILSQEETIASLESTIEAQEIEIERLSKDSSATTPIDEKATPVSSPTSDPDPANASNPVATSMPTREADITEVVEDSYVISGSLTLFDDDARITSNSCSGSRGYNDIRVGTQVVVRDGDGSLLGTGRLEYSDSIRGRGCEFSFEIEVAQSTYYQIEITHRGEMIYTFDELESNDWEINLSLGS